MKRVLLLVTSVVLVTTGLAFAQATSTFNGRVLDQGDAVLPGVTVTVTNLNTGVVRTTVTNEEGVYFMPGLEPGVYDVTTELPGFAPTTRDRVTLAVNATITLDFKMRLAGVEEAVTVTGEAPLIEVTQSKVASSIEATELAEPADDHAHRQRHAGAAARRRADCADSTAARRTSAACRIGGASGTNVIPTVDGADNRDNQLRRAAADLLDRKPRAVPARHQPVHRGRRTHRRRRADDGDQVGDERRSTARRSCFARDEALTAKDYFTEAGERARRSRSAASSSADRSAGPILRNRVFFFGAVEQHAARTRACRCRTTCSTSRSCSWTRPRAGLMPPGLVNPNHPRFGPHAGEPA